MSALKRLNATLRLMCKVASQRGTKFPHWRTDLRYFTQCVGLLPRGLRSSCPHCGGSVHADSGHRQYPHRFILCPAKHNLPFPSPAQVRRAWRYHLRDTGSN